MREQPIKILSAPYFKRDFLLHQVAGLYLLCPLTKAAENYVQENFDEPDPDHIELWPILVLEPSEVQTIVEEFAEGGLTFA